jgi:hypothetical protein
VVAPIILSPHKKVAFLGIQGWGPWKGLKISICQSYGESGKRSQLQPPKGGGLKQWPPEGGSRG